MPTAGVGQRVWGGGLRVSGGGLRDGPGRRAELASAMVERPLVVGAGAAGLAVAAGLAGRGLTCDVLDSASSVGAVWADRYDSLRLHTARRLSGLPGLPIPARYGAWVARDDVVAYLGRYADHHRLALELGVQVRRLDREGDHWVVRTSAGDRRTTQVVLATGFCRRPLLPDWAAAEVGAATGAATGAEHTGKHGVAAGSRGASSPVVLHSSAYRSAAGYRGGRVLVVGAGNSGSEIAADLAASGVEVLVSVRRPPDLVRRDLLGVPSQALAIATRGLPAGVVDRLSRVLRRLSFPDLTGYGLPAPARAAARPGLPATIPILDHGFIAAVRSGRIRVVGAVAALADGAVTLVDGTSVAVTAVVCATGYRPGLDELVGPLGVLDEHGSPRVHGAATLPGAPGLRFAGIGATRTGQLREIGREARAIAAVVAAAG